MTLDPGGDVGPMVRHDHHRHCAIYGVPRVAIADHGSNITARVEGKETIDWNDIKRDTTGKLTTWHLTPTACPWRNGVAERTIGMAKQSLQNRLDNSFTMDFVQLEVAFAKVAEILNNRPIGIKSWTEEDFFAICPADLLHGRTADVGSIQPTSTDLAFLTDPNLLGQQLEDVTRFVDSWWAEWLPLYFQQGMPVTGCGWAGDACGASTSTT